MEPGALPWCVSSVLVQWLVWTASGQTEPAPCVYNTYKMDSVNCSIFYQCDVGQTWTQKVCAPGTVFDSSSNVCGFPPGSCGLITTQLTPDTTTSAELMTSQLTANATAPPSPTATAQLLTTQPATTAPAPASAATATVASSPPTATGPTIPANPVWLDMPYRYVAPVLMNDLSTIVDVTVTTTSSNTVYVRLSVVLSPTILALDQYVNLTSRKPAAFSNLTEYLTAKTKDSGVYDAVIRLSSSEPIHVLLFHSFPDSSAAAMTSISPSSSASHHYAVSVWPPLDQTGFKSYTAVVAVENSTEVNMAFPFRRQPYVAMTINKMEVTSPRTVRAELDSLQTMQIVGSADLTGTLINCSKPVLVFSGTMAEAADLKKIWTLEQQEPVSVAGLAYVIFPSPNQTLAGYAIMALHKSTTVQVPHVMAQDPTSGESHLENEGDEVRLNLTSSGSFHIVLADKPVQVTRVTISPPPPVNGSGAQPDACSASLLSQLAWSNNYSWSLPPRLAGRAGLSVHLYVVMRATLTQSFRLDGQSKSLSWQNLTGPNYASDLSGAHLELDTLYHWVDLNQSAGNFSAYLLVAGPGLRMCTSLGHVATKADLSIDWTSNDGLQEIKYGFDEHSTTAEPQTTASVTDYVTSVASDDATTTLSAGTTSTSAQQTTTTSAANSTANCLVCWAPSNATFNLTTEELGSILEAIRAQLQVNQKVTSAYRRSLECSPDYRPVSNGIGVAGILVCTFVMLFIVASDLSALRHVCGRTETADFKSVQS